MGCGCECVKGACRARDEEKQAVRRKGGRVGEWREGFCSTQTCKWTGPNELAQGRWRKVSNQNGSREKIMGKKGILGQRQRAVLAGFETK